MNIGRSLSNLNGFLKNKVAKEMIKASLHTNDSYTFSLDQLMKVLSIRKEVDLNFFLLDTNITELDIDFENEKVRIPNVEMFHSRIQKKLKLYYSFDDNDILAIESRNITKEKKRELLFIQKIILEKIYSTARVTKDDLHRKLYPNRCIESGLIAEDDDVETVILNDLATLAEYSIRHQSLGNFLRPIILNKDNLVIIKSMQDNSERVYISSVATTLGTCENPFAKGEQLEEALFEKTIYLFSSTGQEITICGILSDFIRRYGFFEGHISYRLEPEYLIKFFMLDKGGIDSVTVELISYQKLFQKGEQRAQEVIGKFAQFEWMVNSYKNELMVSKKKFDSLIRRFPGVDLENLDKLIDNVELGFLPVPETFIEFNQLQDLRNDEAKLKNEFLLLAKNIKKTVEEREFAEKMINYLT